MAASASCTLPSLPRAAARNAQSQKVVGGRARSISRKASW